MYGAAAFGLNYKYGHGVGSKVTPQIYCELIGLAIVLMPNVTTVLY